MFLARIAVLEGEKIEKELQDKINAREVIDSKVAELKNKLGLDEPSDIEKIDELSAKVDMLTGKIEALVKNRQAKKSPVKRATVKKTVTKAKTAVKKATTKAPATKAVKKAQPRPQETVKTVK